MRVVEGRVAGVAVLQFSRFVFWLQAVCIESDTEQKKQIEENKQDVTRISRCTASVMQSN